MPSYPTQVEYPVYWSVVEWCEGFKHLLDLLDVDRAHILGVGELFGYHLHPVLHVSLT